MLTRHPTDRVARDSSRAREGEDIAGTGSMIDVSGTSRERDESHEKTKRTVGENTRVCQRESLAGKRREEREKIKSETRETKRRRRTKDGKQTRGWIVIQILILIRGGVVGRRERGSEAGGERKREARICRNSPQKQSLKSRKIKFSLCTQGLLASLFITRHSIGRRQAIPLLSRLHARYSTASAAMTDAAS